MRVLGLISVVSLLSISLTTHALSAPSAEEQAKEIVAKMTALYAVSEADLQRFDQELENENFNLYESPAYLRLIATRSVLEGLEEQVEVYESQPDFEESLVKAVVDSTGDETFEHGVRMDGLSSALKIASKDHWASMMNHTAFQMTNPQLNNLKQDLKVELSQIRDSLKRRLIHQVGGGFRNINGGGFKNGNWALTYDDGPHKSRTPQVLNLLKQYGYSATFFVLGKLAKAYPSTVRSIINSGNEIANHSYNHPNMAKLGSKSLATQIFTSSDIIESITGQNLRYFRLPYGSGQSKGSIQSMLTKRGLTHVGWNVDSLDWRDKNSQSIYNRVAKQMRSHGGGVILFHDIHSQSVKASEILMRQMRAGKLSGRLMTVSQAR